jgi:DNA-binding transcriptional LysR family regulator
MVSGLPDLEGLAIFAKVAEQRSFAGAAAELKLSKATVSKAIARIEARLGTRLLNRTSRRLALTEAGRALSARAAAMLAEAETAEAEAVSQAAAPRGLVRLTAPMSYGVLYVAPLIPELRGLYPEIALDLHLSDAVVDIIGEGFDAAIRIAALPDSSLVARKLCDMPSYLVAAPACLAAQGAPTHPLELAERPCIAYAHQPGSQTWLFRNATGEAAAVRPTGPLRVNNGEAMLPSLVAGLGFAVLPEFIVRGLLADGRLQIVLPEWQLPPAAVHWVTPPGGPKPRRLQVLGDFLAARLGDATTRRGRAAAVSADFGRSAADA